MRPGMPTISTRTPWGASGPHRRCGALYAQADAHEPRHKAVVRILRAEREALVTTELAVAEADYLILRRLGVDVEIAFLDDLAAGTYIVECLTRDELRTARDVVERPRLAPRSRRRLARRAGASLQDAPHSNLR